MRLCIFPGTFNPIHNAHLKMAQYVIDNFGFDKIIFIPAYKPPHKDYKDELSQHRLNMAKIATNNNFKFEVSDIEFNRDGKSYTYLTILELYKKYQVDEKINMIIGTDAFKKIETWYETEKLRDLVDFIIFIRENEPVDFNYLKDKGYNFKFANMKFLDISSTEIRNRIAAGKEVLDFIPKEEEDYIKEYGLYKN